jgi:signal transduction histidine kinase
MTIRTRLALWYSGLLTLLILIFSVTVITTSRVTILRTIDGVLQDAGQEVRQTISIVPVGEFDPPEPEIAFRSEKVFNAPGVSVQIWQTHYNGENIVPDLLRESQDISERTEPLAPEAITITEPHFITTTVDGIPERVASFPFYDENNNQIGLIQIGTPIRAVEQSNDILLATMVIGAFISIMVSAGLGLWLSQRLLRPIEDITQAAASIADADDLSTRLQWQGPSDELGKLTEVFNHTMARLEHLFNVQQRFIGDVSHELRTPLTSILGNLELMERYGHDPESMDVIHREAKRMSRMVNDLLLLTRADFGELEVDFYPIDLDTIAVDVYEQSLLLKKKRQLSINMGEMEPVRMHGNSDRIRQLMLNLMSNAIKFTGDGGSITLSVYKEGNQAVIKVEDTGIGISDEDKARIFDRFYQADPSRTRDNMTSDEVDGAGLGLSIASWIVNIHNGSIDVQSTVGEGTTFIVRLPLTRETDSRRGQPPRTPPTPRSSPLADSKSTNQRKLPDAPGSSD